MIEAVGYWASFGVGVILMLACAWGLRAFVPRIWRSSTPQARVHSLAISLTLIGLGSNTAYWQVFGQAGLALGWITLAGLRLWGSYLDLIFKGLPSGAVYLHLCAWWLTLDRDDRGRWSVIAMPFYPQGDALVARIVNRIFRKGGKG